MSRNKNKYKQPAPIPEAAKAENAIAVIDQVLSKNDFADLIVRNGLTEALGLNLGLGFPQNQGTGFSTQISEPTTGFVNLRWWLISNLRQFLSQAYVEFGLVQTIVDVPVDDGLRGGIEVKSKQLSEDQIAELLVSLDRDDNITTAGQAAKWNRLFGGAGILILTDQDPEEPLDLKAITKDTNLEFRAVDMWELFWDKQNSEGYDPAIQTEDFEYYNYYGEQVHKSRVMRLKGLTAPSFIRPRLRGWGFSIIEHLVRPINQFLKAQSLTFEVLDEFKVDVYKIKNLTNSLLSAAGTEQVKRRVAVANMQKNFQNAVVMDSEDDWDHKQLSFTGMAEVMKEIRMQIASDMRMPLTKLFGISAAGFNSGEDDIEVYNAMVESQVRNKLKYDLLRICEIKCQKLFGFIPDDISISFKPLRVLSAIDEETVKTQKFARIAQAKAAGELTTLEFRDACNKGDLFDITLDTDEATLGQIEDIKDEASDVGMNPEKNTDTDDPGANRADTQKSRATETGGAPKGEVKPSKPQTPDSDPGEKAKAGEKPKAPVKNAGWDEGKHPRADDGKFGSGGGGSEGGSKKDKPAQKPVPPSAVIKSVALTHQQHVALQDYKRKGFELINTHLRTPGKATVTTAYEKHAADASEIKQAETDIKQIDRAFSKSKLTEDTTVYRGIQIKLEADPEKYVGKVFEDQAYTSTTTNAWLASFHTGIGKHRVIFEIKAKAGMSAINMEQFDAYTGEDEILFPRNSKMKITGFRNEDGAVVFEAEFEEPTTKNSPTIKIDTWVVEPKGMVLTHGIVPKPYSVLERFERILKNTAEFDKHSYEADGGDAWIDPRRREFFENPGNVDEALWSRAKEASQAALGEVRWQFVTWWYKKQGGKFNA